MGNEKQEAVTAFSSLEGGSETMESVYYKHLHESIKDVREDLSDHEQRLRTIEQEKIETARRFDTFSRILEAHETEIANAKDERIKHENTMLKEFRETREANRENMKWLQGMIERQQGEEAAAAERKEITKRTKLQIFRDVSLALLGAIGALWGAVVTYQELILQVFGR